MNTFPSQAAASLVVILVFLIATAFAAEATAQRTGSTKPDSQATKQQPDSKSEKATEQNQDKKPATNSVPSANSEKKPPETAGNRKGLAEPKSGSANQNGTANQSRNSTQPSGNSRSANSPTTKSSSANSGQTPGPANANSAAGQPRTSSPLSGRPNSNAQSTSGNRQGAALQRNPANNSLDSSGKSQNSRGSNASSPPSLPSVVAPNPGTTPTGNSTTKQRTVVEVLGEEGFKDSGLPAEARTMTVDQAVALGSQIAVQEHFGLPKEVTQGMTAEELSEEVGKLQAFGAWDQIKSEEFWKNHNLHGFDVALTPFIRGKLGIPEGIRVDAPSSKIMEEAGEIQNFGLNITNGIHWNLFGEYKSGHKTAQDLIDAANSTSKWSGATRGGASGSSNGRPDNNPGNPGNSNTGNSDGHPGNSSTDLPGKGAGGQQGTGGNSSNGSPNNQNENTPNNSNGGDVDMEGDTIEPFNGESYHSVVTHNEDGSFTVDIYQDDGSGNTTKVNSETYTDADGDGNYDGSNGGSSSGKPAEGSGSADKDDNGNYSWSAKNSESSSDSTDSSSDSEDAGTDDTGSADTGSEGTDSTDKPTEYTPGPDGGVHYNYEWMLATYQRLSTEKFGAGKGGKDSTPNPMNESFGSGTVPFNPKDSVVRPIDGTSSSSGNIPAEAINQIQDPNAVQGGVIDPVKGKNR